METDVVVCGAGPTGLALGCALRLRGVRCILFDRAPAPTAESRALAVQPRTLEVLRRLRVAEDFLAAGLPVSRMLLHAGNGTLLAVDFSILATSFPFLLSIPQAQTEEILQRRFLALGGELLRNANLMSLAQGDRHAAVTVQQGERTLGIRGSWLVGCDGAHSAVRHLLGLPFRGKRYQERFLLADLPLDRGSAVAEGFLTSPGIVAVIPMPRPGFHRVIASLPPRYPEVAPTLALLEELLAERGVPLRILGAPQWMSIFSIHRRIVPAMRSGRIFLAGDAAHIHSPAGGQGMNTGIQDAFDLGWKLALVHQGRSPLSLLATYEDERRPVALRVLRSTDRLTRFMTVSSPLLGRLRNRLISWAAERPEVAEQLARRIAELDVHCRRSAIVGESGDFSHPSVRPGERVGEVDLPGFSLSAVTAATSHLLLVISRGPLSAGAHAAAAEGERYAPELSVLRVANDPRHERNGLPERLLQHFGISDEGLVVIRPDGMLAWRQTPAEPAALRIFLDGILLEPQREPASRLNH